MHIRTNMELVMKIDCRLTNGVTGKFGYFSLVHLMSSFSVVIIVVLFLPRNFFADRSSKKYDIAFRAGQSFGSLITCPSSYHLLSYIVFDSGSELVFLYIVVGNSLWPLYS